MSSWNESESAVLKRVEISSYLLMTAVYVKLKTTVWAGIFFIPRRKFCLKTAFLPFMDEGEKIFLSVKGILLWIKCGKKDAIEIVAKLLMNDNYQRAEFL